MLKKPAYYNEKDKYAAQWLRNLIAAGHIAPGDVDERSIEDVRPNDLAGYAQCHFFAGVGVWSHALRQAGWPDDRPIWTGSCPCQPFSSAGAGNGFADERHLWPAFHFLIEQCKPAIVLGEQVASKDADPWIDLVCVDMEALDYSLGALAFPAAGLGAPHIRDRLYWAAIRGYQGRANRMGHANGLGTWGLGRGVCEAVYRENGQHSPHDAVAPGAACELGDPNGTGSQTCECASVPGARGRVEGGTTQQPGGALGRLADTKRNGRGRKAKSADHLGAQADRPTDQHSRHRSASVAWTGPVNGHWADADWLLCRDGKWRPVEPGTQPLAHGAASRVGRLRAYGNAICAEAATAFIECVMNSDVIETV